MTTSAITSGMVSKLVSKAETATKSLSRVREKAAETMGIAIGTMEIGASSFGFGYARGRFANQADGKFEVMGVPPDLLAAVVLHGMGFLGAFDKYSEHAHNLGNGALASFLTTKGVQFGVEGRAEDKKFPTGVRAVGGGDGYAAIGAGQVRMTDADLAREIARASA